MLQQSGTMYYRQWAFLSIAARRLSVPDCQLQEGPVQQLADSLGVDVHCWFVSRAPHCPCCLAHLLSSSSGALERVGATSFFSP